MPSTHGDLALVLHMPYGGRFLPRRCRRATMAVSMPILPGFGVASSVVV